ncbi:MAG TPA: hypothetical protein VJP02_05585 [Candidatus Sulfotelmatobacter sp.]|nr:hypothetical protein [Candidatus Sulfotelmatobacter sp.]
MRLLRSQQTSSPEHWSKDFVEHLRTVHFALMAVSAGLIVLLSSVQYDVKAAAAQLARINEILTLWSHVYPPNEFLSSTTTPNTGYTQWLEGELVLDKPQSPHANYLFHLTGLNLFECDSGHYIQLDSSFAPKTTEEFATWWDSIASTPMVIDSIFTINRDGKALTIKLAKNGRDSDWVDVGHVRLLAPGKANGDRAQVGLTLDSSFCHDDYRSAVPVVLEGHDENYDFRFNVDSIRRNRLSQKGVTLLFRGAVGSFATAFPDLAKAAHHREDVDFATLTTQINGEVSKGTDVFDAFGVKVPSEQITRWGMLILISVQLYFVMYLKRLSRKLKPDDPGWDVPWMAMDESLMARIMLAVSVVALPCAAAALVLIRGDSPWFPGGFTWHLIDIFKSLDYADRVKFFLMPIAVLTSFVLSGLAWHYRPQLVEPVAPAQLFE